MSSPFTSQLGTNYCPLDEEVTQIKALLIEPCLELKVLDQEIAVLRKALDKRDALGAYVDAHKALLSPIRRLPRDIIEEIFMACLPTRRNCAMSAKEAPVILGRVCSAWRAISLSTPRLWSRLHIVQPASPRSFFNLPPGLRQAKVAQRLEVADAWLKRSGNCPLSISLEGAIAINYPDFSAEQDQFLDLLIPHASRWQNIYLFIPFSSLQRLSHLTENDVPLLEGFQLSLHYEDYLSLSPEEIDAKFKWTPSPAGILHAPKLLRFSMKEIITTTSQLPLRWNQLTSLDLMGPPIGVGHPQTCDIVLDALSGCHNLRTCKVVVVGPPETLPRDLIIELLFLHSFDLICIGASTVTSGRLLGHLLLPELHNLKLDGLEDAGSAASADPLISFLAASTRLETISISSSTFTKSCLTTFLCGLPPTIRRLDIFENRERHPWVGAVLDDDDVLATLELRPDGSTVCPALLELVISPFNAISDEALFRVITSRIPTLRRVDVAFDREMEVDILPRLQSFVESGAQISITYPTVPLGYFSPWIGLPDRPLGSS